MRLLFDTESDGFVATSTKIHCIGIINVDTGEYKGYRPDQIDEAISDLDKADRLKWNTKIGRYEVASDMDNMEFDPNDEKEDMKF